MSSLRPRRTTLLVLFAFVLGTIAIPTLHLTFHTVPHDHAGGATHYTDDNHGPAGRHEHSGADARRHRHDDGRHREHPRPPFDPQHGDGSAGHFSLAISDGAETAVPLLAAAPAESGRLAPAPEASAAAAHVSVRRFRGPPVRG